MADYCRASSAEEKLSEDIDQLFELTKIMVLVLSGLVPGLEDNNTTGNPQLFFLSGIVTDYDCQPDML